MTSSSSARRLSLHATGSLVAVAAMLSAASGAAADVVPAFVAFSDLPVAYAQLAPATATLRARVDAVPGVALGGSGEALSAPLDADGGALATQGMRASVSGFGYSSRVGSDARALGYKTSGSGVTLGIDRVFGPTFLGGVALSYSRGRTSALGANSETDTLSGAVYGAWLPYAGWEIEGLLGIDSSTIESRRVLTFGTTPVLTRGETDSLGFNAVGNVGYRFRWPTQMGAAFFKPFAGVAYSSQDRDGYAEVGPLGVGLLFPEKTFERSTVNLGAAAGIDIAVGGGWTLRPEVRVAWSHYLSDPAPNVLAFSGGTVPVVLRDPHPGRDGAVVGLEVTALSAGLQVFAGYAGEFRENATAHQGRLGLRVAW